ncbi:helical hairpin domain-containing protein, partial [Corynebacterium pyruviciproducens]
AQNGELILTKNKNISKLDRLVEEFNFLAINQVSNFKQFEILEGQFLAQLSETDQTLESLDNKIVYLNKLLGALLDYQNELVPSQISLHLLETYKINKEMSPESLRK